MLEYTPPTILLSGISEMFVTHVVDPSHFHCQLAESATKLDVLMDELHHYCSSPEPRQDEGLCYALGEPCLAQYTGDQGWYRVIITGILQKNSLLEVSFVDYGNNEILPRGSLKKMKPEFMELPIQAIQCGLAGIESRQGFWSPEHTAQFEDLILEKTFKCRFISLLEGDSVCSVELSDNTGKNINVHFGQMTGTLKTEAGPRVVAPGAGGDHMNISVSNDRGSGGDPRRPFGTDRGPSRSFGGRESDWEGGGGRQAFGDWRGPPQETRDGDYGALAAGGNGWGQNTRAGVDRRNRGRGGGNQFGGGDSNPYPNGHDDCFDVDYDASSSGRRQNRTSHQGNTWASGFGRTSNDRPDAGGSPSPPWNIAETFRPLTLSLGETLEVYVVFVNTPVNFWCQLSKNTEEIDLLMEKLDTYYNGLSPEENPLKNAKEGSVCAAQYSEDNRWYRGIVKHKDVDKCQVQFIDYGNADFVPISGLKALAPSFFSLPIQAVKCGLKSAASLAEEWSDATIQKFEELTLDQPMNCKIISAGAEGGTLVELIDSTSGTVIGDQLIQLELAQARKAPVPETALAPTRVTKPDPVPVPKTPEFIEQNFGNGQKTDVVVSWMVSPEAFWCQLVGQHTQIENLSRDLQTRYSKGGSAGLSAGSVTKGMSVVAKFSEDGCWYRGQIVDNGSSKVQVQFVDYGNQETVALSSVQLPEESTMKTPKLAVKCVLRDVKPASGNRWSDKTVSYLETVIANQATCVFHGKQDDAYVVDLIAQGKNITDELERAGLGKKSGGPTLSNAAAMFLKTTLVKEGQQVGVFVTSVDSVNSFWCQPSFAAEIELETAYSSPVPAVSAPSIGTACVTKFSEDGFWYRAEVIQKVGNDYVVRFVDYGNSENVSGMELKILKPEFSEIPPQSFHCSLFGLPTVNSADVKKKFEELTLEKEIQATITKQVGDIYSLDMNDSGKSINHQIASMCTPASPAVTAPVVNDPVVSSPAVSAEYLPVPNLSGQSLKAYVSATISLDEFCIQRADSQPDLDKMTEAMKSSASGSTITNLKPGQACAVKYPEDQSWYRGMVSSVAGNSAKALFVDYGNSEQIPLTDIRGVLPEVLEVPPLAYPCSLASTKPAGGKWSSEALTMFEDMIMDKELTITFTTSKQVKISSPDGDVGELLIRAGFAQGSKSQMPTTRLPQSQVSTSTEKYYPPIALPGNHVVGYITHIDKSGLSIQPTAWTDQINLVMEQLETLAAGLEGQVGLSNLCLNQACCAKFSEDNAWYRGQIKEVGSNVTVRFVDFGNSESIDRAGVKDLPAELVQAAPLAIPCCLQGKPSLTDEEVGLLKTNTEDTEVVAEVFSLAEPFQILLTDGSGSTFLPPEEKVNQVPEHTVQNTAPPVTSAAPQTSRKMAKVQVAHGRTTGYLTEVDNQGIVYLHLASDEDKLADMTDRLQSYSGDFMAGNFPIGNTEIEQECCAMFSDDSAWYRAVITDKKGSQATVRFVDFGNSETMPDVSQLQSIPSDLIDTPPFALGCKLNISPGLASHEKPTLIDLTDGKCLSVVFLSTVEPFEVRLEDEDGCDILETLRPNTEVLLTPIKDRPPINKAYPVPDIPEGSVQGYVTQVEKSGLIFVQLCKDEDALAMFADHIQELAPSFVNLQPVTLESPCCAKFSEDNHWYRATVVETGPPIKVRFVDYGNLDSTDSVMDVPDELLEVAPYALTCKLKGCKKLCEDEVEMITLQTQDQTVNIQFLSKTAPFEMKLSDSNGVEISSLDDSRLESSISTTAQIPAKIADTTVTAAPQSTSVQRYPKQVVPSAPVVAFLTAVDNNGIFYVQLGEDTEKIDVLAESLQTLAAGFSDIVGDVVAGQACCTNFAEDDQWYRATVTQMKGSDAVVRFVDYGNPDTVPRDLLKSVPPTLMKEPPFSFPCRLAGCGVLDEDEVAKFKEVTEKETLTVTFESVTEPYETSVTTGNGMLVLNLVRESHSDIPASTEESEPVDVDVPTETATEITGSDAVDLQFQELTLSLDSREEVYVSYVDCPSSFWCHPVRSEHQLTELMDSIAEYCGQLTEAERGNASPLPSGLSCLAKFSHDEGWYRARVMQTMNEGYEVLFVDYGNKEVLADTDIVSMKMDYMLLPAQAICFSLAGIDCPEGGWTTEAVKKFTAVTADKKLMVEVKGHLDNESDARYHVQLLDLGIDIASQLDLASEPAVMSRLDISDSKTSEPTVLPEVVTRSLLNQRLHSVESEMDSLQLTDSLRVQVSDSITALSETCEIGEQSQYEDDSSSDFFQHIPLTEGSRIEVTVSHSENPSEFWVQMKEHKVELDAMMELLHETYCSLATEERSATLQLGQPCAALFADDESWYRGIVQEMDPAKNLVTVCYVDYGNTETVARTEVRKLQPDFMALPIQAIECGLSGVRFQGTMWTEDTKTKFEELVLEKSLVATVLGVGEDGDCMVDLMDMGMSISQKMIEQGLGVSTDTPIPTPPHLKMVFPDSPVTKVPLIEATESKSDESNSEGFATPPTGGEEFSTAEADTGSYLRLSVTVGQELKVFIGHADSPGNFWCQPVRSSTKLEDLMARLQERYTEMPATDQEQPLWKVGDLCAAMFSEDQQYYRAQITSDVEGSFLVCFVDCGNKQAVSASELRLLPEDLRTLEAQGLHCSLSAIKPEIGEWEVMTCSRFDELTYQKELNVQVIGLGRSSGVLSVTLHDGELNVGESLVSEGYAMRDSSVEVVTITVQGDETADNSELNFYSCASIKIPEEESLFSPISVTLATPTEKVFREDFNSAMLGAVSHALSVLESTPDDGYQVVSDSTKDTCLLSPIARSEDGDGDIGASTVEMDDMMCSTIQLKLSNFNYLELDVDSELLVHVCNMRDPSNFGIQPVASSTELEKLMADITAYMETEESVSSPVDGLQEGSPCLAQFSDDDQWYRAHVHSISGAEYKVTFVDYGNSEERAVTHIRKLPSSMLELPAQYISCCLADIWSDGDTWRPDTITTFKEMCEDKPLNGRVTKKDEEGLCHIYLYDNEDHTGWSFNRYLLSKGAELIPGSDMEIELEMEETMNLELEASFQDMSMNIENSIEDSEDSSDADDTREITALTAMAKLTPMNQRDTGENDQAEEDQLVEVSATEAEQSAELVDTPDETGSDHFKPDESLVNFDTTVENSWAVSDESSLPPEDSVQLSDDIAVTGQNNVLSGVWES